MPYEIKYDKQQDVIDVTFTGVITMTLTKEYIADLIPILEETGCQRVLSDCRETELQLSSMDIVQFPKMAQAHPLTARLKRAVVASKGTSGYELYETLSTLQGQNIHVFEDRPVAAAWLISEFSDSCSGD